MTNEQHHHEGHHDHNGEHTHDDGHAHDQNNPFVDAAESNHAPEHADHAPEGLGHDGHDHNHGEHGDEHGEHNHEHGEHNHLEHGDQAEQPQHMEGDHPREGHDHTPTADEFRDENVTGYAERPNTDNHGHDADQETGYGLTEQQYDDRVDSRVTGYGDHGHGADAGEADSPVAEDVDSTQVLDSHDDHPTEVVGHSSADSTQVLDSHDDHPTEVVGHSNAEPTQVLDTNDHEPTQVVDQPHSEPTQVLDAPSRDVDATQEIHSTTPEGVYRESHDSSRAGAAALGGAALGAGAVGAASAGAASAAFAPAPSSAATADLNDDGVEHTAVMPSTEDDERRAGEIRERERLLEEERAAHRREAEEARRRSLGTVTPDTTEAEAIPAKPVKPFKRTTDRFHGALALFLLRIVVATILALRGYRILTDIAGTQNRLTEVGVPSAGMISWGLGIATLMGAVCLLFGFITRVVGFFIAAAAIAGLAFVIWKGWPFVAGQTGFTGEFEVLMAAVGLLFLLVGGGGWGIDGGVRRARIRTKAGY